MVRNIVKAIVVIAAVVGMVGVLQTSTAKATKDDEPKGNSSIDTKTCEEITLNAPTGVKPKDASYQYYIDETAVSEGDNSVTAGEHTVTLYVGESKVDTDVVTVDACEDQSPKVTICHRTNSVTNPYVIETVAQSAVDGVAGNSGKKPDHYGKHQGPLAYSEAYAQALKDSKTKWGDIIPPVDGFHSGLNWSALGQKMLANGCKYVPFTSFSWKCVEATKSFVATFTNNGGANSSVMVNDQSATVAPGETKDLTVVTGDASVQIKVTVDGEVVFERAVACIQGQGSTEIPVTPAGGQGAATGVASLPFTGSAGSQLASLIAIIASVATAIAGYVVRSRTATSL